MNDSGSIEQGVIGWGGVDDAVDITGGDKTDLPLFRVTLTRGRNHAKDLEETAQGLQVTCRWGILVHYVPPVGTQVIVAFPAGMKGVSGGGVIISVVAPNGSQFKADRAILDVGSSGHLLIKGKSVTLCDYATPARYLMVGTSRAGGPPGVSIQDETGSGLTVQSGVVGLFTASGSPADAKCILQLTTTSASCALKSGTASWKLTEGMCSTYGTTNLCTGAGVYLGKAPTVANPVLWGASGPVGVASLSVFVSPA